MIIRLLFLVLFTATRAAAQHDTARDLPPGHFLRAVTFDEFILPASLALGVILFVYLILWLLVGRDPQKGTIRAQDAPPPGLSPAAARYLLLERYDHLTMVVGLVSLAVKGVFTLRAVAEQFCVIRHDLDYPGETIRDQMARLANDRPPGYFSPDEQRLAQLLFPQGPQFTFTSDLRHDLRDVIKEMQRHLHARYAGTLFRDNRWAMLVGVVLSSLAFLTVLYRYSRGGHWLELLAFLGGLLLLSLIPSSIATVRQMWRGMLATPVDQIRKGYFTLTTALGCILFAGIGFGLFWYAPWPLAVFMLTVTGMNAVFLYLLRASTPRGRRMLDALEGFKASLAMAIDRKRCPEVTRELFEAYLPYALALDIAPHWARRYAMSSQSDPFHLPGWYEGALWDKGGVQAIATALQTRWPDAIASALLPSSEELYEQAARAQRQAIRQNLGGGGFDT